MKTLLNLFIIALFLLISGSNQAEIFTPLDIQSVKVGGEIGRRIDITINNNVLVLNADRDFLQPFKDKNKTGGLY